ncbi:MAG: DUF2207 domain-containing protein [Peptostreptococcaceae bacterium]|nr:DUF2207 domain-containing protein [Peptostreptococcaceae bacterium]
MTKKIRRFGMISLMMILLMSFGITAYGAEEIRSIDIDVLLNDDGSADITQTWDISTGKGTEFYIVMSNMGDMEIENFKVKDETGREFTYVDYWDVNGSIEDKAYKNGINYTGSGMELCWGKGSYGNHVYTISYRMTNLVKSYPDNDGFLTRFVNDSMSPEVERAKVRIRRADANPNESFVATETGVFAYGFKGYINVIDGEIIAESDEAISGKRHMTILVRLPKGLLHPVSSGYGTFAELEERANEGSDYTSDNDYDSEGDSFGEGMAVNISGIIVFLMFVFGVKGSKSLGKEKAKLLSQYRKLKKEMPTLEYYRQLPMNGSLSQTKYALINGGETVKPESIMSAYMLRLIRQKALIVQKHVDTYKEREEMSFVLNTNVSLSGEIEQKLFELISKAAGKDLILQEKEMKRWAKNNYKKIDDWLKSVSVTGEAGFREKNGFVVEKNRGIKSILTQEGFRMITEALGFKKYLDDFTLIAEREVKEVELWDDYLVYAALFGIADKVAKEMKRINPDFVQQSEFYNGDADAWTTIYMANSINRAMSSGYSSGRYESMGGSRSSGGGGFSSMGGGGGFSGGGSGGGSR